MAARLTQTFETIEPPCGPVSVSTAVRLSFLTASSTAIVMATITSPHTLVVVQAKCVSQLEAELDMPLIDVPCEVTVQIRVNRFASARARAMANLAAEAEHAGQSDSIADHVVTYRYVYYAQPVVLAALPRELPRTSETPVSLTLSTIGLGGHWAKVIAAHRAAKISNHNWVTVLQLPSVQPLVYLCDRATNTLLHTLPAQVVQLADSSLAKHAMSPTEPQVLPNLQFAATFTVPAGLPLIELNAYVSFNGIPPKFHAPKHATVSVFTPGTLEEVQPQVIARRGGGFRLRGYGFRRDAHSVVRLLSGDGTHYFDFKAIFVNDEALRCKSPPDLYGLFTVLLSENGGYSFNVQPTSFHLLFVPALRIRGVQPVIGTDEPTYQIRFMPDFRMPSGATYFPMHSFPGFLHMRDTLSVEFKVVRGEEELKEVIPAVYDESTGLVLCKPPTRMMLGEDHSVTLEVTLLMESSVRSNGLTFILCRAPEILRVRPLFLSHQPGARCHIDLRAPGVLDTNDFVVRIAAPSALPQLTPPRATDAGCLFVRASARSQHTKHVVSVSFELPSVLPKQPVAAAAYWASIRRWHRAGGSKAAKRANWVLAQRKWDMVCPITRAHIISCEVSLNGGYSWSHTQDARNETLVVAPSADASDWQAVWTREAEFRPFCAVQLVNRTQQQVVRLADVLKQRQCLALAFLAVSAKHSVMVDWDAEFGSGGFSNATGPEMTRVGWRVLEVLLQPLATVAGYHGPFTLPSNLEGPQPSPSPARHSDVATSPVRAGSPGSAAGGSPPSSRRGRRARSPPKHTSALVPATLAAAQREQWRAAQFASELDAQTMGYWVLVRKFAQRTLHQFLTHRDEHGGFVPVAHMPTGRLVVLRLRDEDSGASTDVLGMMSRRGVATFLFNQSVLSEFGNRRTVAYASRDGVLFNSVLHVASNQPLSPRMYSEPVFRHAVPGIACVKGGTSIFMASEAALPMPTKQPVTVLFCLRRITSIAKGGRRSTNSLIEKRRQRAVAVAGVLVGHTIHCLTPAVDYEALANLVIAVDGITLHPIPGTVWMVQDPVLRDIQPRAVLVGQQVQLKVEFDALPPSSAWDRTGLMSACQLRVQVPQPQPDDESRAIGEAQPSDAATDLVIPLVPEQVTGRVMTLVLAAQPPAVCAALLSATRIEMDMALDGQTSAVVGNLLDHAQLYSAPSINGITPSVAWDTPGAFLLITGDKFTQLGGSNIQVKFMGPCSDAEAVQAAIALSDDVLRVSTPNWRRLTTSHQVRFCVSLSHGQFGVPASSVFNVIPAPTVSNYVWQGQQVHIQGSGFDNSAGVRLWLRVAPNSGAAVNNGKANGVRDPTPPSTSPRTHGLKRGMRTVISVTTRPTIIKRRSRVIQDLEVLVKSDALVVVKVPKDIAVPNDGSSAWLHINDEQGIVVW